MIKQIADLMNEKVQDVITTHNILDVVVSATASYYDITDVSISREHPVFMIGIDPYHEVLMGIHPDNKHVNVVVNEARENVGNMVGIATLSIDTNGEFEESFKKMNSPIEFKRNVSGLFTHIEYAIEHANDGPDQEPDHEPEQELTDEVTEEQILAPHEDVVDVSEDTITEVSE